MTFFKKKIVFRTCTHKVGNYFHLLVLFRKEPDPGHWENVQEQDLVPWSCECPMRWGCARAEPWEGRASSMAFPGWSCKNNIYCRSCKGLWIKQSRILSLHCPFLSSEQPTPQGNQWLWWQLKRRLGALWAACSFSHPTSPHSIPSRTFLEHSMGYMRPCSDSIVLPSCSQMLDV